MTGVTVVDGRELACVHVAAQATVLRLGGLRVTKAIVRPDNSTGVGFDDDNQKMGECAVGLVAGQEAEIDWLWRHHRLNRRDAFAGTLAKTALEMAQLPRLCAAAAISEDTARRRARRTIRSEWARVERLVTELYASGELGGESL